MTVVLKAMPLRSAGGERQDRVFAVQGLNLRLLIDGEHRRVRRWVQIQTNDIGRLLLEVRVVRGHVALDPMGLEPVLAPHARHHHVADLQMGGELARGPVRRGTRCMARTLQNPRLQRRREHTRHLAYVPAVESGDPLLSEALAPAGHKASAALDALARFIPRMAIGKEQNQSRSSGIFRPIRSAARSPAQFHTLRVRQADSVCHGRYYSLQMTVTVH